LGPLATESLCICYALPDDGFVHKRKHGEKIV